VQQQVYQVHDVDELKQCLINVWHSFEQSVINDARDKVAHTSLCGYSCELRKFCAFNLTPYNANFILPVTFVNFENIKQMLLCYMQQTFAK